MVGTCSARSARERQRRGKGRSYTAITRWGLSHPIDRAQPVSRARLGGHDLQSNYVLSSGVRLAPNASAWSSLSDVNSKEHFRNLNGADVLAKIAEMPIREWNYKAQDAAVRHVGPTAQDFHAAFGLGEGTRFASAPSTPTASRWRPSRRSKHAPAERTRPWRAEDPKFASASRRSNG